MKLNGRAIFGIGVGAGLAGSALITLGIHNARKIRKYRQECEESKKQKKTKKK